MVYFSQGPCWNGGIYQPENATCLCPYSFAGSYCQRYYIGKSQCFVGFRLIFKYTGISRYIHVYSRYAYRDTFFCSAICHLVIYALLGLHGLFIYQRLQIHPESIFDNSTHCFGGKTTLGACKTGLSPPPSIFILTVPRRHFCCGSLLFLLSVFILWFIYYVSDIFCKF